MSEQLLTSIVTVVTAIIGVAFIAVLVSRNANTSGVLSASSSAFSRGLSTALSPVTGSGLLSGNFSFTGGSGVLGANFGA